jgi:nicotinate-nucleotide adenylyltransferase
VTSRIPGLDEAPPLRRRRGPRLFRRVPEAPPLPRKPTRAIGLLGGSFNPAHEGHLYVSREALKRLGLDQVWWLVSPQNPLKPRAGMAPFEDRLAYARALVDDPRIRVSDLEARLDVTYTADTLARLARLPGQRFIWLIGADNLAQLPLWRHWRRIFALAPIAVFDRAPHSSSAAAGRAASVFGHARLPEREALHLKDRPTPAWVYLHLPPHPASSTAIRAGRQDAAIRETAP